MIKFFTFFLFPLYLHSSPFKETPKVVEVETLSKGDIQKTTTLIGVIKAKRSVLLTSKNIGIVNKAAPSGEFIKKGGIIAKLDNIDTEKSFDLMEQAEKIARDQYDRTNTLAKANAVNKQTLEDAKNQWLLAQKSLLAAKLDLEKTQFIAPFDGIVGNYKIREGSQAQAGDAVVNFYDPSTMLVEFDIPAHILTKVTAPHDIILDGKTYILHNIPKSVDSDTYMAPVSCDIDRSNYFSGQVVEITFPVEISKDTLIISADAVFLKDAKPSIYKVVDGKTDLVEVQTGLQEKDKIEIKDGAKEGDVIVVYGQDRLYPETEVEIAKKKQ
jgi:membrane fusion protein (multidrug efflux system)